MIKRLWISCLCLLIGLWSAEAQDVVHSIKMLLLEDRFEEVILVTDTIAVADSIQDEIFYFRGRAYQALLSYDRAYHYYYFAAALDSNSISYRVAVGQMLAKLGRSREAIEVYEGLRADSLAGTQQLAELASLYSLRKDYKSSLEIYHHLLSYDSLNYFFLKQAGNCYEDLNQADSALNFFKSAFELNPADVYLTHHITNIYLKKQDLENAIYSMQKGFVYDTNNIDLLKLRGYIWLLTSQFEMAVWDLEKARAQDSNSVFIMKYLGLSYHEVKAFDEARETLRRAFLLDSTDAEIAFFLASSLRWSKHEEESIIYFNKSIELQQPDPDDLKKVYLQLAELYKVLHRFDEALESYDPAQVCDPEDNVIWFKIGQVYDHNLNQKKVAIEYYEKYLDKGPTGQQLFNTAEGKSSSLEQQVKERIDKLKEDLFFENQLE
ncbi:MAG TPA: tetratricopeptide repeat protein [Bacteroides sp.]|nr:tetratricopeptide repeat protein [Bacteroides sp.]